MKNALLAVFAVAVAVFAFLGGMKWQEFKYNDICLDMGGGRNPGKYPICVVEKKRASAKSVKKAKPKPKAAASPVKHLKPVIAAQKPSDSLGKRIIGSWVEPVPGNEKAFQGFTLNADGTAKSINMATLLYRKWQIAGNKIILTVESKGNRTSSVENEEYIIRSVDKKTLRLQMGKGVFEYRRR